MQADNYKYLHFVPFSDLSNWSVQYLLGNIFAYSDKYDLVEIGSFLTRNKTGIDIEDEVEYKRATIKIDNGGIFLRDIQKGVNIGTKKQYIISEGQFLLSKIDARNGAFGVVPKELETGIITSNFWAFDVDYSKIIPHFLSLITTTQKFIHFSEIASNGTTNRHYLQENLFLSQKIPLPILSEQQRILDNYNTTIRQAKKFEQQAKALEEEIEKYLCKALGIENNEKEVQTEKLHFVKSSEITQWGVEFVLNPLKKKINQFNIYKTNDLCKIGSGGTPNRSRKNYYEYGTIPWIKTGELNNSVLTDTEEKITEEALKNSTAKLYRKGSIAIAMYGATMGKTAKLGIDAATNQACAVLFDINNNLISTDYLWEYFQSQTKRLKSLAYGSAQPNLNAGIISNYEIIVPPFSVQNKIVAYIQSIKEQIKVLIQNAARNKNRAIAEFEKEIFK
jgi:restriction endonuclease S subunit